MNWDAISAISEMTGALAVVISLVYLASQIRQNTRQMEQSERTAMAASVSTSATSYRENRQHIYTNPDVARIFIKGTTNPEDLDEIERYRFRLLLSNFADANWDMYAQTVITGYSPETWQTQGRQAIKRVLATPGGRWFWQDYCDEYPKEFRIEIDGILDSMALEEGSKVES